MSDRQASRRSDPASYGPGHGFISWDEWLHEVLVSIRRKIKERDD